MVGIKGREAQENQEGKMSLDILSPLGQESARQEQEMLSSLMSIFPKTKFVNTPKSEPAKIDGFTIRDNEITSCFESKCRTMTLEQLKNGFNNEWLITYEKIIHGCDIARKLCVPFYGLLYLVTDRVIIMLKIADKDGNLIPKMRIERTTTSKCINGGTMVGANAFIDISTAKQFPIK